MKTRLAVTLETLRTPNFALMSALTLYQLRLIEQAKRIEAATARPLGKRIGARQWLSAIRNERTRRGAK